MDHCGSLLIGALKWCIKWSQGPLSSAQFQALSATTHPIKLMTGLMDQVWWIRCIGARNSWISGQLVLGVENHCFKRLRLSPILAYFVFKGLLEQLLHFSIWWEGIDDQFFGMFLLSEYILSKPKQLFNGITPIPNIFSPCWVWNNLHIAAVIKCSDLLLGVDSVITNSVVGTPAVVGWLCS